MRNLKKGAYWRLFLCLAGGFSGTALADSACPAQRFDDTARVSYVHDGDTVHLRDGRKVRLIGINTPELARDDLPEQAFAAEAREALDAAIAANGYRVGMVYGSERHDRHRRTLAHLFTPGGENLQAELLQRGLAVAIAHPPNTAFTDCYSDQERAARSRHSGIWSIPEHSVHVSRLGADTRGFNLVSGTVEHISHSARGVRIFIGSLMLGIQPENLEHFDLAELSALRGKQVTVRGWLHPANSGQDKKKSHADRREKYFMTIRHPSAIEINRTETESRCYNTLLC